MTTMLSMARGRIAAVLCAFLLVFVVTACGSDDNGAGSPGGTTEQTDTSDGESTTEEP